LVSSPSPFFQSDRSSLEISAIFALSCGFPRLDENFARLFRQVDGRTPSSLTLPFPWNEPLLARFGSAPKSKVPHSLSRVSSSSRPPDTAHLRLDLFTFKASPSLVVPNQIWTQSTRNSALSRILQGAIFPKVPLNLLPSDRYRGPSPAPWHRLESHPKKTLAALLLTAPPQFLRPFSKCILPHARLLPLNDPSAPK